VHATHPLEFFNGLGGFAAEGREYVVTLGEGECTPAPWINVVANAEFGFLASADGSGSTWSLNAQQNQLTPWSTIPSATRPRRRLHSRRSQRRSLERDSPPHSRAVLGPCHPPWLRLQPIPAHRARHLAGSSAIRAARGSVKISRLTIVNRCAEPRRLSVTHYLEWVLGNQRSRTAPFIVTEIEPTTGAMLARNPWARTFNRASHSWTWRPAAGVHGRSCGVHRPPWVSRRAAALLEAHRLSNRVGGGLDPCGAMQTNFTLQPGEATELRFLLGEEASSAAAVALVERHRTLDLDAALKEVTDFWEQTLGAVQVKTPDRSMDVLVNGWLLYQTLSCRVWARTAFYQSSGAYGFRDQLQDVMALAVSRPGIAREHILRAAGRQFDEGMCSIGGSDIRPGGEDRVSDDRIWLAFVVAHYLEVTEDFAVLEEQVPFLAAVRWRPKPTKAFRRPSLRARGRCSNTACALSIPVLRSVRMACRYSAPAIGTTA